MRNPSFRAEFFLSFVSRSALASFGFALFFCALFFCGGTTQLAAQETASSGNTDSSEAVEITLSEQITVSANRIDSPVDSVGSTVTVITAEEIERRGKTNVAELLRTVPGVAVARSGGAGQVTSVFLRGGNSSHTLVLLDGVRLNSTTSGAFDFADLATDNIERIEILRGPQSSLYGSEAMGGVVSIFTRRGDGEVSLSGSLEAGNLGYTRAQANLGGGREAFDYSLSVSSESQDGVSAAQERNGNTEDDPYDNTTASTRLGFDFADDGRLDLNLRAFTGDVDIDGFDFASGGAIDDLNARQERDGFAAHLKVTRNFGQRWRQSFSFGNYDEELTGKDEDNPFGNFVIDSRVSEFVTQSDVELSAADTLSFGYGVEKREGGSRGSFEESLDVRSFFLQNVYAVERFSFTAGVRNDDHSEFGDETTYRLTGSWQAPASGTRLHGSFGTGFKAPTLNDLFFPFFSNPDLQPETNKGFDAGVEQTWGEGKVVLDLTWFDLSFDDLIVFDFETFLPQNIAKADSSGLELSLQVKPGDKVQFSLSHTYNDTEDLATGRQLARRPEHRSVFDVFYQPLERLRGSASLLVVRDRIDSDGTDLDDYERVDLTLHYRASSNFEPYLRVENLFDQDYEEINTFSNPGLQAALGLSLKL